MKKLLSLAFLAIIIMSCGVTGKFKKLDVETIEFGSGGGFTGIYTTYTIDIEKKTLASGETMIKTLSKDDLKKIYDLVKSSDLHQVTVNKPGNMTYFINFKGDTLDNQLLWGDRDYKSPEAKMLYQFLTAMASDNLSQ